MNFTSKNIDVYSICMGFPGGSAVKNPPAMQETMQETQVWSLGREDPLEEDMATHSSILALRIPTDRGASHAIFHTIAKSQTWLKWLGTHIQDP